jgi:hypothetical protein
MDIPLIVNVSVLVAVSWTVTLLIISEYAPRTFDRIVTCIDSVPGLTRSWNYIYRQISKIFR